MTKIRVRYPDRCGYDRENLGRLANEPGDGNARSRSRGSPSRPMPPRVSASFR